MIENANDRPKFLTEEPVKNRWVIEGMNSVVERIPTRVCMPSWVFVLIVNLCVVAGIIAAWMCGMRTCLGGRTE